MVRAAGRPATDAVAPGRSTAEVVALGSPEVLLVAQRRLNEAIRAAVAAGGVVPCLAVREPLWVSGKERDQQRAAELCAGCPVIEACRAVADVQPVLFGVWAGRIYHRRMQVHGSRSVSEADAERVRELVAAAAETPRYSAERRARDRALFELVEAGCGSRMVAEAVGLTLPMVAAMVREERIRRGVPTWVA